METSLNLIENSQVIGSSRYPTQKKRLMNFTNKEEVFGQCEFSILLEWENQAEVELDWGHKFCKYWLLRFWQEKIINSWIVYDTSSWNIYWPMHYGNQEMLTGKIF